MGRIPKWARDHRREVQEFAVVLRHGRWRPATYLGKAWFSHETEMRYRLSAGYAQAQRWCEVANRDRLKARLEWLRRRDLT